MARSTQFVGLTHRAEKFVEGLQVLESDTQCAGMFDEKISLRKWSYENGVLRECVQACPWSSGPMIFTCLEWTMKSGAKVLILQWIEDPDVHGEVDYKNGRFWV